MGKYNPVYGCVAIVVNWTTDSSLTISPQTGVWALELLFEDDFDDDAESLKGWTVD
jgi:hypothetical protein